MHVQNWSFFDDNLISLTEMFHVILLNFRRYLVDTDYNVVLSILLCLIQASFENLGSSGSISLHSYLWDLLAFCSLAPNFSSFILLFIVVFFITINTFTIYIFTVYPSSFSLFTKISSSPMMGLFYLTIHLLQISYKPVQFSWH